MSTLLGVYSLLRFTLMALKKKILPWFYHATVYAASLSGNPFLFSQLGLVILWDLINAYMSLVWVKDTSSTPHQGGAHLISVISAT